MQVGVFVPINNNGWLISENAPQYMPSFDLNKQIAQSAEQHGLDFLLSMIKLRGFGGKTEFWEYGLESFTLMAGLAAVTDKIKIYATCPTLVIPPAFAARMCNTIDSISHGRFGLNLITGCAPNTARWGCGRATSIFATAIRCSANTRRSCANAGRPGAAISRATITRWTIAWSGPNPKAT
jgi:Luciferase-like monooxygenase